MSLPSASHNEPTRNVPLIETSCTIRRVEGTAACGCCCCGEPVHGEAIFIEGHLDDGSPGCHRFVDHPDCTWDMAHDLDEIQRGDGCCSHGCAIDVVDTNYSDRNLMTSWKLKRTAQCEQCPWRIEVDPHDIPNGYCESKHQALAATIAEPGALPIPGAALRAMACHETDNAHCVGWLHHQLGPGNNLALRLRMRSCDNADRLRLRGEQHPSFEATLPRSPVDSA